MASRYHRSKESQGDATSHDTGCISSVSEETFSKGGQMPPKQGGSKNKGSRRRSKIKPRGKSWVIERSWVDRERTVPRKGEARDWAAIPGDVLSAIFEKLGPINILLTAQFVCRSWHQAAHDPRSWRCADFTIAYWDLFDYNWTGFAELVMAAVDRSKGSIEKFCVDYAGEDRTLLYMAQRSSKLKQLRLVSCYQIDDEALIETFKVCPLLEDLDITIHSFYDVFELEHNWPPLLKRFCLIVLTAPRREDADNMVALCIARNMPQLRELQIVGDCLSNEGLRAILDGCPFLDDLDLRRCFNVDLRDDGIKSRCCRIKKLRGPQDSTADIPFRIDDKPSLD